MDFRRWVVIPVEDLDQVNYRDPYVITSNCRTVIKNIAGTEAIVSYYDPQPKCIQDIETKSQEYNRQEIETLLASEAWYVEPELGV